jgi:adenylate cyclase
VRTEQEIRDDIRDALRHKDQRQLLKLADEIGAFGTDNAMGIAHNARGLAAGQASQYDLAISEYRKAQEYAARAHNQILLTSIHNNLGSIFNNLGQLDEAQVEYSASLDLAIETGHEINMSLAYANLGLLWANRGDYQRAIQVMLRGLEIEERLDDEEAVAASLGNVGVVYYRMGDLAMSLQYVLRALDINERIDNKWGIAINMGNAASAYVGIGDYANAIGYFQRAIALHEAVGNVSSVARTHANLAVALKATKELEQAREHLQIALQMHRELGNLNELIFTASNLVQTYLQLGDVAQARDVVQAMEKHPATDPRSRTLFQSAKGLLAQAEGDLERAHELMTGALQIAQEIGASDLTMDMHKDLRDLAKIRGDLDDYIKHNELFLEQKEQHSGNDISTRLATMSSERTIAAERAEREKERAVLHSTLPKHIVERVLRGDDVSGDLIEDAAILFLDIVGFTSRSTIMPPKELTGLLRQIFTAFDNILQEHGVLKVKTIGDSYMAAALGAANDMPSEARRTEGRIEALRVAKVALAMMASPFSWPHTNERVMFRVGLHCGPVVAGVLGLDRLQYDVWGDTVNVASRMESTSEPGRIHVSEAFADVLRIQRGEVEIKGKGAMQTYWLEGAR